MEKVYLSSYEILMKRTIEIFLCYAHEDEHLLEGLKKQLRALQRQGIIILWHDRNISPGVEWKREIETYLDKADIIPPACQSGLSEFGLLL